LAVVASRFVHGSASESPAIAREHDRATRAQALLADTQLTLALEHATTAKQLDPALLQPGQLACVVEVVDDLVAPRERSCNVELAFGRLRRPLNAARLRQRLRGAEQALRGHAGEIRAFPADQVLLDQGDRKVCLGQAPCAHLPSRPRPQHQHVELPDLVHDLPSVFCRKFER
jgi:hypothetical protein